jgi:uncharacterized protein YjdB
MNKVLKTMANMLAIASFAATLVSCDKNEISSVVEVTSVTITPPAVIVKLGEKQTVVATVEPANASNKSVIWSSNAKAVAEVDASTGEITAKATGRATITVYAANSKKATCVVTVATNVIDVESVTITPAALKLGTGEKQTLVATINPESASNKILTWNSSNPAVAEVDNLTGEVTAKTTGSATITATATNGMKAECVVTVEAAFVSATSVTLSDSTLTLEVEEQGSLRAIFAPDNATDKTVVWSSNNEDIATVDASTGVITAIAVGSATITATTSNNKTATCKVTVVGRAAVSVTITPEELTLVEKAVEKLTATVAPADADQTVTWSSDNESTVKVDASTGEVTAIAVGEATITATTANGITDECKVTVNPIEVTSVTVTPSTLTIERTKKQTLTANVEPENATYKTITWSSSDESTVKVDASTGEVTAIAVGSATITATATNGTTATCEVTVTVLPLSGANTFKGPHVLTATTPLILEARNFDFGGDGVGFHDSNNTNDPGCSYRADNGDPNGGAADVENLGNIGHTAPGEWLQYTIGVEDAGTYAIDVSLSPYDGATFSVSMDGVQSASTRVTEALSQWDNWRWVFDTYTDLSSTQPKYRLETGVHTFRFNIESIGYNFMYYRFTRIGD